jgi:hypothetical protein
MAALETSANTSPDFVPRPDEKDKPLSRAPAMNRN